MDLYSSTIGLLLEWDLKSLLLFISVFIITADYIKNHRPASFPPGPPSLPIVGNIFTVDLSRPHESFLKLAAEYGDLYSLRFGQQWTVVLNGYKALKEALVTKGDSVIDRPHLPLQDEIAKGLGVIFSNGTNWKEQRRFALSTLRYFGFGKKSLEPVILKEFAHCAEELRSFKGKPFDPHLIVNNTVANIICHLVFGHRFEYGDEKFRKLMLLFDRALQIEASIWAQLYNSFTLIMRCLPGPHQTLKQIWREVQTFIGEELKEHKQTWDPSDARDYIDFYLKEIQKMMEDMYCIKKIAFLSVSYSNRVNWEQMKACGLKVTVPSTPQRRISNELLLLCRNFVLETTQTKGQQDSVFDEENLIMCVLDLFVAGSETTSTTLRWAFLYMAKYPEIQEKVQAEIHKVIGKSKPPSMEDRAELPYTDAVIHEVQRIGNIAPLALPHATNKDVQLGAFTIPKGVLIIPNLTSVLFDEKEWETPHTFNPGHFLNEDGKFVKRAAFVPFSAGKRLCLGENLARMELFLFFTSFMQHFSFSMPAGVEPVFDYRAGLTLAPKPYKICVQACCEK